MEANIFYKLDVTRPSHKPLTVYAKQSDDASRKLTVRFVDGNGDIILPTTAAVTLRVSKPDGTSAFIGGSALHPNADGTVTVTLTDDVLAVPGYAEADIKVTDSGSVLSTLNFAIDIQQYPHGNNIPSDDIWDSLAGVIDKAEEAMAAVDELEQEIKNKYFELTVANSTAITTGTDLNTIRTIGNYTFASSVTSSLQNCPFSNGAAKLLVVRLYNTSGACMQILIRNAGSGEIYKRNYASSTWSDWECLETQIDSLRADLTALQNAVAPMQTGYLAAGFDMSTALGRTAGVTDDMDDLTEGSYHIRANTDIANITNLPTGFNSTAKVYVLKTYDGTSGKAYIQLIIATTGAVVYKRSKSASGSWTDWNCLDAEVNALNQAVNTLERTMAEVQPLAYSTRTDLTLTQGQVAGIQTDLATVTDKMDAVYSEDPRSSITPLLYLTGWSDLILSTVGHTLQLYITGSSDQGTRFLVLDGQKERASTTHAFSKTLPAGTYKWTLTKNKDINLYLSYTYTTFAEAESTHLVNGSVVTFEHDAMVGLYVPAGSYGNSSNPTIVEIYSTELGARDAVARQTADQAIRDTLSLSSVCLSAGLEQSTALGTDADYPDDMDDLALGTYHINNRSFVANIQHLPDGFNSTAKIFVLNTYHTSTEDAYVQIIVATTGAKIYKRYKSASGEWSAWTCLDDLSSRVAALEARING